MDYIRNPRERGETNRRRVFDFFVENPCHTNRDAAQALDLSEMTVSKHARAIRDGWRPECEAEQ